MDIKNLYNLFIYVISFLLIAFIINTFCATVLLLQHQGLEPAYNLFVKSFVSILLTIILLNINRFSWAVLIYLIYAISLFFLDMNNLFTMNPLFWLKHKEIQPFITIIFGALLLAFSICALISWFWLKIPMDKIKQKFKL